MGEIPPINSCCLLEGAVGGLLYGLLPPAPLLIEFAGEVAKDEFRLVPPSRRIGEEGGLCPMGLLEDFRFDCDSKKSTRKRSTWLSPLSDSTKSTSLLFSTENSFSSRASFSFSAFKDPAVCSHSRTLDESTCERLTWSSSSRRCTIVRLSSPTSSVSE
jgi:hypothetical protein